VLKTWYTAAPHFQATEMPVVLAAKVPCQATGPWTRPFACAKLVGTKKATPVRKVSSLPDSGTMVVQVFVAVLNVVDAQTVLGSKVICAFGTLML